MTINREHWLNHVKEVIRSRHYTWLPQGLGGEPVEEAMTCLVADIMHICKLSEIPMEEVLERARRRFEEEEAAELLSKSAHAETPENASQDDGDEIIVAFESNDLYEAEIVRGLLQGEGIDSRVDSTSQGGFTELFNAKVLIHSGDAETAHRIIRDHTNLDE